MTHQDPVAHNSLAWDREVESGNEWTLPFGPEVIAAARDGDLTKLVLIGHEPVPRAWLPDVLSGVDVLCLASGGGQQGPLLAAAGATVTVLDNSARQLGQDEVVARREGLSIATAQGDMRDLSRWADASFDVVFHPVSNLFVPEVPPMWRECFRVLRPGGRLLAGFLNPDVFILDAEAIDRGEMIVRHKLPYSDLTHLTEQERERMWGLDAPIEFSHSLTDQIGGQLAAGFHLLGFAEAPHHVGITAEYLPGYFATYAVKPTSARQ